MHGIAVYQHSAGTALALTAPLLGASQPDFLSQYIYQRSIGRYAQDVVLPIDR
jgi:hypothetical protein